MKQLILLLLLLPMTQVFADTDNSLKIEAVAVEGTQLLTINGVTTTIQSDVTFIIRSPNGNIITIGQVTPDINGVLSTQFIVGKTWSQDGDYVVTATQTDPLGNIIMDTVVVKIINGVIVPEFGTIAMMILVVTVTNMVLLTKSKLVK